MINLCLLIIKMSEQKLPSWLQSHKDQVSTGHLKKQIKLNNNNINFQDDDLNTLLHKNLFTLVLNTWDRLIWILSNIETLFKYGADPYIKNKDGKTPYDLILLIPDFVDVEYNVRDVVLNIYLKYYSHHVEDVD